MISIGEWAFITIGIPGARHVLVSLVPCPPAAWSARLALKRASYSGVSGASWVVPQHLIGSNEGWPLHDGMRTPVHWPLRFECEDVAACECERGRQRDDGDQASVKHD